MKHPACHSLPSVGSTWKPSCESELKIKLAQSHKLSWCLVGFNGHIVSIVPEGRSFTAGDSTAHMYWINTFRTPLKEPSLIIAIFLLCTLLMAVLNYPAVLSVDTRPHYQLFFHLFSRIPGQPACKTFFRTRTRCVRNQNRSSNVEPCV